MISFWNYVKIRLENAMKTTAYVWCEEISRIVDECGVKELQNLLPVITDSLFELNSQVILILQSSLAVFWNVDQARWSLRTLTKTSHCRDYEAVAHLLSPKGSLMMLCYKLLADSSIKYEFPLSCVPVKTRMTAHISEFFLYGNFVCRLPPDTCWRKELSHHFMLGNCNTILS